MFGVVHFSHTSGHSDANTAEAEAQQGMLEDMDKWRREHPCAVIHQVQQYTYHLLGEITAGAGFLFEEPLPQVVGELKIPFNKHLFYNAVVGAVGRPPQSRKETPGDVRWVWSTHTEKGRTNFALAVPRISGWLHLFDLDARSCCICAQDASMLDIHILFHVS